MMGPDRVKEKNNQQMWKLVFNFHIEKWNLLKQSSFLPQ